MDSFPGAIRPLSLDERAVALACAITIDVDYFSRHSNSNAGFLPFPMFGWGGGSSESTPAPEVTGGAPLPPVQAPPPTGDIISNPGVGMPFPIPPTDPFSTSSPSSSTPPPPSSPTPDQAQNEWGESPFLSDEQAGISSNTESFGLGGAADDAGESGIGSAISSITDFIRNVFGDD